MELPHLIAHPRKKERPPQPRRTTLCRSMTQWTLRGRPACRSALPCGCREVGKKSPMQKTCLASRGAINCAMATEVYRPPGAVSYTIRVIGARRPGVRDAYHALLRMSWWGVIAVIALVFILLNAIFAL